MFIVDRNPADDVYIHSYRREDPAKRPCTLLALPKQCLYNGQVLQLYIVFLSSLNVWTDIFHSSSE